MNRRLALVATLVLVAGCGDQVPVRKHGDPLPGSSQASAPDAPRPAWVDHPPSEPSKLYAAGGGRTRDDAVAKAKREIGAQISVSVKAVSTGMTQETTTISASGQRLSRVTESYRDQYELTVDQRELPGITIVEEVQSGRDHWALAVFDRAAWAQSLRTQIADVDAKLTAERDRWKASGGALAATVAAFRATAPLGAEREALLKRLRTADPAGAMPAWPVDLAKLRQVLAQQLDDLAIRVTGAEGPDLLDSRIQSALAKTGVRVMSRGDTPLTAAIELRLTPRDLPNGWKRWNGAMQATIRASDGRVLGTIPVDESGTDAVDAQAKARCLDNLAAKLATAIDEQLLDLLAR